VQSVIPVVIKLFFTASGRKKPATRIEEIGGAISRYLESNEDNLGLNLASAIYRLSSDDFDNADGYRRFDRFLEAYLLEQKTGEIEAGFLELFENLTNAGRRRLGEHALRISQNISLAIGLFERFGLDQARDFALSDMNRRLEKLI